MTTCKTEFKKCRGADGELGRGGESGPAASRGLDLPPSWPADYMTPRTAITGTETSTVHVQNEGRGGGILNR